MDESQVMQLLFENISRLELPPISEKVLIAIREKKQEISKNSLIHLATEKEHKGTLTKYLFAAILTLLTVSVPIIVVLSNKTPVSNSQNILGLSNNKEIVSIAESQIVSSTTENKTALQYIKFKHIYGEVVLSDKSEKELETLLVTYSTKDSVYEDDKYIYNFDSHGRLIEMRKVAFGDEEGKPVDEHAISVKVNALLKEYYPDWLQSDYNINIEKNENRRFLWSVDITKKHEDLSKELLYITFEKIGTLKAIVHLGDKENIGVISKAEAIQISLKAIKNEKYENSKFDDKEVDITVNFKKTENKLYYVVNIEKIPYAIVNGKVYCAGYLFLVDSKTGKYSLVAHSP